MSTQDNGGPAFPGPVSGNGSDHQIGNTEWQAHGMTLRDYFAAKAMQAMVSKSTGQDKTGGEKGVPLIAQYAYEFADAMLKARA